MTPRFFSLALALSSAVLAVPSASAQPARTPVASSRSVIVPPLPVPPVDPNASPATFLLTARGAVERDRLGEAQEALERAETRLLDRSVAPAAGVPDRQIALQDIGTARRALAVRDRADALPAIDDALRALEISPARPEAPPQTVAGGPIALPPVPLWPPRVVPAPGAAPALAAAPIVPVPVLPPPPPPQTYAQLPGRWQLEGACYVWIPPDRSPRRVEDRAVAPNQYVWSNGRWVFVPQHYVAP